MPDLSLAEVTLKKIVDKRQHKLQILHEENDATVHMSNIRSIPDL